MNPSRESDNTRSPADGNSVPSPRPPADDSGALPRPARARPRRHYDYTQGSIGRAIFRLAVPSCLEQVSWNLDTMAELYWVGHLGTDYLAAISLCFMTIFFLRAIGLGIRIAGSALVAQRVGGGDTEGASVVTAQTMLLACMYYLLVTAGGYLLAPYIMAVLTSDPEVLRLGTSYLRASFLFFASLDGLFTIVNQVRAAGEPGLTLAGMVTATTVSVTTMPLFMFGVGSLPGLGLAGSAVAVGTGRLSGSLLMIFFLTSGWSRLNLRAAHFRPKPDLMRRMIRLGWPAAAQNLLERSSNLILLKMLALFGPVVLAAWGVGNRVTTVSRMPGFGLQSAVRTLVGQNVGAGFPERALLSFKYSMASLIVVMGVATFLLLHEAETVVTFFGLTGEAIDVGVLSVRILSVGLLFETIRRMTAGAFQGAGNTKPPMVVEGAVRWGFQLPAAYLAAFPLGLAGAGVWGAMAGTQILSGTALLVLFFRWSRRRGLTSYADAERAPAAREESRATSRL